MAIKIIYSKYVKDDLKDITQWYSRINNALTKKFSSDFRNKINLIKENPQSFEIKYENYRIIFLDTFPYGIHYEFFEAESCIKIYAVFHTSRNPQIWQERK